MKGNARDRRRAARAARFGPPGWPTHRQALMEQSFVREVDPEAHLKADVREVERRQFDPAKEGIIQEPVPPLRYLERK